MASSPATDKGLDLCTGGGKATSFADVGSGSTIEKQLQEKNCLPGHTDDFASDSGEDSAAAELKRRQEHKKLFRSCIESGEIFGTFRTRKFQALDWQVLLERREELCALIAEIEAEEMKSM